MRVRVRVACDVRGGSIPLSLLACAPRSPDLTTLQVARLVMMGGRHDPSELVEWNFGVRLCTLFARPLHRPSYHHSACLNADGVRTSEERA